MNEFERGGYLVAAKVQKVLDGLTVFGISPQAQAKIEAVLDEHTPDHPDTLQARRMVAEAVQA